MRRRFVGLFAIGLLCMGCVRTDTSPADGKKILKSIRPLTEADRERIAAHEATVLRLLKTPDGDARLMHDENDLRLLQQLVLERKVTADQTVDLEALGIVLGQVFATRTPLRWITVEMNGKRQLALQYPGTRVIVFPGTMISKRVRAGERFEIPELYRDIAAQVEKMKDDPKWKK